MVNNKALDAFAEIDTHRSITSEEMADFYAADAALAGEIVATLSNVDADIERKKEFAYDIMDLMEHVKEAGTSEAAWARNRDELLEGAEATRTQLIRFYKLLIKHRGNCPDFEAVDLMGTTIKKGCDLKDVVTCFNAFIYNFGALETGERKQGTRNLDGQIAGLGLSDLWDLYFKDTPKTGKGRKCVYNNAPIKRDYDLLCDLLSDVYGITVSTDPRTIEKFRERRKTQKAHRQERASKQATLLEKKLK